jgi:hypothetical protein
MMSEKPKERFAARIYLTMWELDNGHFIVGNADRNDMPFVHDQKNAGFSRQAEAVKHAVRLVTERFSAKKKERMP